MKRGEIFLHHLDLWFGRFSEPVWTYVMLFVAINRAWLQAQVFHLVDGSDWLQPCTGERPGTLGEIWSLASGKGYHLENARI
jgi:hypothetical protein